MNKKISLGKSLAIVLIAITVTVAITMSISMKVYNNLIKELPNRVSMYSSISEMDELVRKEFYGDFDTSKLNSSIAHGYIKGLGDESSFYMTADEYIEYYNRESGRISGIGVSHTLNKDTGYIHITGVAPNSPAEAAGLKVGDEIRMIGEDKVTAENYETISQNLIGDKMSTINITYKRDGEDSKKISVVKGYSIATVSHRMIGSTAIVTINAFYGNTPAQFKEIMGEVKKSGAKGVIFDVRNCSQGSIKNAVSVLDILVPLATDGTKAIATAVNQNGKVIKTFPSDAEDIIIPSVVLINDKTAGAAELFACDLRDFGKAELVGTTTKGIGTMQQVFQLSDGSAIVLTVAQILPYKSDSYNKVGVKPDYEIKLTPKQETAIGVMEDSDDPQIQKAFSLLPQSE